MEGPEGTGNYRERRGGWTPFGGGVNSPSTETFDLESSSTLIGRGLKQGSYRFGGMKDWKMKRFVSGDRKFLGSYLYLSFVGRKSFVESMMDS